MKKIAVLMIVALGMVCTRAVADEYVFSVDGKYAATAPRTLPSNGRNFETGNVVSNLSVQTAETLVKCGWYKVIVPSYELGMLQYPVTVGYTFDATKGTATANIEIRDGAPVKKYTQYKVIGVLLQMGKWNDVKQFLVDNNLYDMFMAAQYLSTDDPNFFAAKKQMARLLGITDQELDALLANCIDN